MWLGGYVEGLPPAKISKGRGPRLGRYVGPLAGIVATTERL